MTRPDERTPAELLREGFRRCFIAEEPRLSEAVEAYHEIGCQVVLVAVADDEPGCTACMRSEPDRYRTIYVRAAAPARGDTPERAR